MKRKSRRGSPPQNPAEGERGKKLAFFLCCGATPELVLCSARTAVSCSLGLEEYGSLRRCPAALVMKRTLSPSPNESARTPRSP
ncbi:hypothetical protein SKAU_G00234960 [Synaphobranchus kaupii]|uniref:Uncharacterized protein n=1 Tax=Synaphobranchus kaupii TaxID=118154 RepID=A0A9Q1F6K8_SYNKA|nr:hypothetical protein SKAU_G00234960 [Synaphobranchus kaupii]